MQSLDGPCNLFEPDMWRLSPKTCSSHALFELVTQITTESVHVEFFLSGSVMTLPNEFDCQWNCDIQTNCGAWFRLRLPIR